MNNKLSTNFRQKFCLPLATGLVLTLSACATIPEPATAESVTALAPVANVPINALNAEADSALKAAEQSVVEARIQRALWIAAVDELAKARAAAKIFDNEATLKHARETISLCNLSLQQKQAPPVTW